MQLLGYEDAVFREDLRGFVCLCVFLKKGPGPRRSASWRFASSRKKLSKSSVKSSIWMPQLFSKTGQRARSSRKHLDKSPESSKGKPAARARAGPCRSARSQLDEPGERRERPRHLAAASLEGPGEGRERESLGLTGTCLSRHCGRQSSGNPKAPSGRRVRGLGSHYDDDHVYKS